MNQAVITDKGQITMLKNVICINGKKKYLCLDGCHDSVKPIDEDYYIQSGKVKEL
jgi:hypothetical protein